MPKNPLIEYQAAALVGMSPELLRWLSKYAPKYKSSRKLLVAKREASVLYFDKETLLDFDRWLKEPWPHPPSRQRPAIPQGIRDEIKTEASGLCAMCRSYAQSCEAAHIDPVAKSKNNHPHNLIWLCTNHHTAYDNGGLGPDSSSRKFVRAFKTQLHRFRMQLWKNQSDITLRIYALLDICTQLEKLRSSATDEQLIAIKPVTEDVLKLVPELAKGESSQLAAGAYLAIADDVKALKLLNPSKNAKGSKKKHKSVSAIRESYRIAAGLELCPLCDGSGQHSGYDCPVCTASGAIMEGQFVDISMFEEVTCSLCKGADFWRGEECPVCHGDKRLERRFDEQIELSDYDEVDCPLCDGKGLKHGDDCPACHGDKRMQRRFVDTINLADYADVDCPVCEGRGARDGEICPVCHGDRQLERRIADGIDVSDYETVTCPLCDGAKVRNGYDCSVCNGDGKLEKRFAEEVDLREYETIKCQVCKGRGQRNGQDCPACGGEGEIERNVASNMDFSDFEEIKCPSCKGRGTSEWGDCKKCGGEGKVEKRYT